MYLSLDVGILSQKRMHVVTFALLLFITACSSPGKRQPIGTLKLGLEQAIRGFHELQICSLEQPQFADFSQGLVAYYPLQSDAQDHSNSPSIHHGQVISGTSSVSYGNGGITLDGSNYIRIAGHNDFRSSATNSMTFSFTIQSEDYVTEQVILARKASTNKGHFYMKVQDRKLYFAFQGVLRTEDASKTPTPPAYAAAHSFPILENGLKYRVVWGKTWNNQTVLYVNGHQVPLKEVDAQFDRLLGYADTNNALSTYIGAEDDSSSTASRRFKGIISHVTIWNRQLTESELRSQCEPMHIVELPTASIFIQEHQPGPLKIVYDNETKFFDVGILTLKNNQRKIYPQRIIKVQGNTFRLYYYPQLGAELLYMDLDMVQKQGYFVFEIKHVSAELQLLIEQIELLSFQPTQLLRGTSGAAWSKNASDQAIFANVLPMNIDTLCPQSTTFATGYNLKKKNDLFCYSGGKLAYHTMKAALIIGQKSDYLTTIENMILQEGLPYVTGIDGKWIRRSQSLKEMFYFMTARQDWSVHLEKAAVAGFRYVVFSIKLQAGDADFGNPQFNITGDTGNERQWLIEAINAFKSHGFHVGLHMFMNTIQPTDPIFHAYPNRSVFKREVGNLQQDISSSDTTISLSQDIKQLVFYPSLFAANKSKKQGLLVMIGDELMFCPNAPALENGLYRLHGCQRGHAVSPQQTQGESLQKRAHVKGAPVYLVPYDNGFHVNDEDLEIHDYFTTILAQLVNQYDISVLHLDSFKYPIVSKEHQTYEIALAMDDKKGLLPNLIKFNRVPLIFSGGGVIPSFSWYYQPINMGFDSRPFAPRAFDEQYRVRFKMKEGSNVYGQAQSDMGWWGLYNGAGFEQGRVDRLPTELDDLNYVASQAMAYGTTFWLHQHHWNNPKNTVMGHEMELLQTLGRYLNITRAGIVPDSVLQYLRDNPSTDVRLNRIGDSYHLVRKVNQAGDAKWGSSPASIAIKNDFKSQKLRLTLYAKHHFDTNQTTANLLPQPAAVLKGKSISPGTVTSCSIDNGMLKMNITSGSGPGACQFTLQDNIVSTISKRGFSFKLDGTNEGQLFIVRLKQGVGRRDYTFANTFSGTKVVELDRPVTSAFDRVGSQVFSLAPHPELTGRFAGFPRSSTNSQLLLIIKNIKLGTVNDIKLDMLRLMQEDQIIETTEPSLTVGTQSVTFPIKLATHETPKTGQHKNDVFQGNGSKFYEHHSHYMYNNDRTSSMSFSFIFKYTSTSISAANYQTILSRRDPTSGNNGHFHIFTYDNKLCFSSHSAQQAAWEHCTGAIFQPNKDYHVVIAKSWGASAQVQFHIKQGATGSWQEVSVTQQTLATPAHVTSDYQASSNTYERYTTSNGTSRTKYALFIGATHMGNAMAHHFVGIIDEVKIWNTYLYCPDSTVSNESLIFYQSFEAGIMMDYNGYTEQYNVYNSQKLLRARGFMPSNIVLSKGMTDARLKAKTGNKLFYKIELFDDSDGDGIPDDGDFDGQPSNNICGPQQSFCDDN